eukprot:TRINITY_DN15593_c0_g1_i1.p1 TRINITY_DN15593_c0_g1~~TRINITY_DN15593_c0_g1_i1.p1  ORF type:complete len:502 (-),score=71.47 TRINITY_DN15593_c0_g1_i1:8-1513(-)
MRSARLAQPLDQSSFLNTPLDRLLPPNLLISDAQTMAFEAFDTAAHHVPAYRKFLEGFSPVSPKNWDQVPIINKENYINKYSLADRCINGDLTLAADVIHLSSGSSGKPTFWARSLTDELKISALFEQIIHDNFHAHECTSLVVIVLPMGAWVGGLYTSNCFRNLVTKGYPLTVITPGTNPSEALRIFQNLSPDYDQTIIVGYPPFVKSLIDSGLRENLPFGSYNLKMILAGEVFTEEWRKLVGSRGGCSDSSSIVSIYGTADAGVIACETALSSRIRARISEDPALAQRLFKNETCRLPTFAQFDPRSRFLETNPTTHATILVTTCGDDVMTPLLRYDIGDAGGVIEFDEVVECHGLEGIVEEITKEGWTVRKMPFVFVYGRQHWVVSVFGANVYVENIMAALDSTEIAPRVTGKFILTTTHDSDSDVRLHIIVELVPGIPTNSPELSEQIGKNILTTLKRLNSEYDHYVPEERQFPLVELREFSDQNHFRAGVKHQYTL